MSARDQVDSSMLRFVWRHSRTEQIAILLITLAGLPLLYLSLELPKTIINDAIQGEGFPREVMGRSFAQTPYLLLLCSVFLATVIGINILKWFTNVAVGLTGERMLRRLRFRLFEQTLRFPSRRIAATRPGEIVQSVLGEIEPLGGFIGEIVATPMMQGGMLVTFVGFIFVQDPLLGLAASAMLPVQAVVIPWLQKRVIRLNRERAANNRRLADTLASAASHVPDIRGHGVQRWHMALVSGRLHTNTAIRKALFRRKFTIKFVNNLLNQLTPFLFFSIGGTMVIRGQLDLGALVAVVTAYKDLGKPWRELLNFYQRFSDFRSRFEVVAESFAGADLMPATRIHAPPRQRPQGPLVIEDAALEAQGQELAVPRLDIPPGALVVLSGGGAEPRVALMRLAAGLESPQRGSVTLGGVDLSMLNPAELGGAVGVVDSDPLILDGSLRRNIEYALFRNAPSLLGRQSGDATLMRREARRTGMPMHDPDGDWVDYAAAGCADATQLRTRIIELADMAGMSGDLIAAALNMPLAQAGKADGMERLSAARAAVGDAITLQGLDSFVERWCAETMAENASLLENMLFALPDDPDEDPGALLDRPGVRGALAEAQGLALLAEIGTDLARAFASLAATVSPDSPLLDRVGSYARADILAAEGLVARLPGRGSVLRDRTVRRQLIAWGARYTPVRDRFDAMNPARCAAVMAIRRRLLAAGPIAGFTRLDSATPPGALTLAESLIGGRRRENRRAGWRRLESALVGAITDAGLRDTLIAVGLDAPVEAAMSPGMRQRLSLMRVAVKRPQVTIVPAEGLAEDGAVRSFLRRAVPEAILIMGSDDAAVQAEAEILARLDDDGTLRPVTGARNSPAVRPVDVSEPVAQGGH
jgi:putative ABC transport system ATP-binding protein